jgi:hypothetical protein
MSDEAETYIHDIAESRRRERHRRIREASEAALASAEFRKALDDLKARCAAARRPYRPAGPVSDIEFDFEQERTEGWALEPIGNVFA